MPLWPRLSKLGRQRFPRLLQTRTWPGGGSIVASNNEATDISALAASWQGAGIPVANNAGADNAAAQSATLDILRDFIGWFKQVSNSVYGVVHDDVYGTIRSIVYDTLTGSSRDYVYADVYKTVDGGTNYGNHQSGDASEIYKKVFSGATGAPWKGVASTEAWGYDYVKVTGVEGNDSVNCPHVNHVGHYEFLPESKTFVFVTHCNMCGADSVVVKKAAKETVIKPAAPSVDGEVEYTATARIDGKLLKATTTRSIPALSGGGSGSGGGSTVTPGGGSSSGGGSGAPSTPSTPSNPGSADQPNTPGQPSNPGDPSTPEQPTKPTTPASTTVNKVTYVVDEATGSVTASVNPKATNATVRSTVTVDGKTYKVTALTSATTEGCDKLKTLTVGKGITTISKGALTNCTSLTSLTLGSDVATVPSKALAKCKKLKTVTIKSDKLTKKQFAKLLKGSKVATIKLSGKAAKSKKAAYTKWIKSAKKTVKVKLV